MKFIRYIPDSQRRYIIGLCLSLLLPLPVWSVTLEGDLTQGGMVIGRVSPGDEVTVNKHTIRVSPDGVFLLGFGRDDKLNHDLVVSRDGKLIEQKRISITKREYLIQQINGLPPSKVTPPKRDWDRIKRETALVKKARRLNDDRHDFLTGFIWPAQGIISGVYGSQRVLNGEPKRPHFGVDVAAPVGTTVVVPADGIVTLAHPDMFYSGGTLIVDHGHQLSSSFLHLHKILVKVGERVKRGEPIAEIGATGRVTGAHLDWRMNLRNARIDPQFLVPPMPDAE
ncbi:MAG: M23 family metallopeptidase [Candidatus Thiodiazotropha sp. (ex Ustalcina ferruginea)]|nr:M23 family metallopeptidase [Candidatus Thiodiazotropha sp. (ex Ustalcina ferruginea)]